MDKNVAFLYGILKTISKTEKKLAEAFAMSANVKIIVHKCYTVVFHDTLLTTIKLAFTLEGYTLPIFYLQKLYVFVSDD